jgi:hypothetical protein
LGFCWANEDVAQAATSIATDAVMIPALKIFKVIPPVFESDFQLSVKKEEPI